MTRKDYELHAKLIGHALACAFHSAATQAHEHTRLAHEAGLNLGPCDGAPTCKNCNAYGEDARTLLYENLYEPFCAVARADNPRFDTLRFSHAVARAESACLDRLRQY